MRPHKRPRDSFLVTSRDHFGVRGLELRAVDGGRGARAQQGRERGGGQWRYVGAKSVKLTEIKPTATLALCASQLDSVDSVSRKGNGDRIPVSRVHVQQERCVACVNVPDGLGHTDDTE